MKPVALTEELLLSIRKPARYIGREHNSITKDWDKADVKICLCYPDLYEIGMSNLGIKILYHILNKREDILCERSFAPWPDMEEAMIKNNLSLFSLENRAPLSEFDILGFSFSYELTYTNMLTMLFLAKIPFMRKDRQGKNFPLIIAGGPSVFNPEPLADFMDLFLIGDGEEAVIEIADTYKRFKSDRNRMLRAVAGTEGVYVPRLHDKSSKIQKRSVRDLRPEDFPTKPVVPYIQVVHDRIAVEVMRGCPNQCYFCQARNIYSPVRVRDRQEALNIAVESYKNTGLDEVSLLSLSSSDYPGIDKLIKELTNIFLPAGVGISLPSLRIEDSTEELPFLISLVKKSSLTFAPEAGSERLLNVINKNIDREKLFKALRHAYENGWRRIKLYFMIGLPSENEEDVSSIIDFADSVALYRKEFSRHPAEVIVNVSSFIPKPHTPFEREKMACADELKTKQNLLSAKAKGKRYLNLKFHDIDTSILEAFFARAGKSAGAILIKAWESGCRFDGWSETFKSKIWSEILEAFSRNPEDYLCGADKDDGLPWSFITCHTRQKKP